MWQTLFIRIADAVIFKVISFEQNEQNPHKFFKTQYFENVYMKMFGN
jgi:hypothetical protein